MARREMSAMVNKDTSLWWLCDSPNAPRRSSWLQSTLGELDRKAKAMLRLIEEDADSFAQRAEMYYKKRPELVSLVEEFYRMHRSLAEKYDKIKPEPARRSTSTMEGSPFTTRDSSEKPVGLLAQMSDTHSDIYDPDDCAVSEVDDPDNELDREAFERTDSENEDHDGGISRSKLKQMKTATGARAGATVIDVGEYGRGIRALRVEVDDKGEMDMGGVTGNSLYELRIEMESVKEENLVLKDQLLQKDEDKREVIRQLTSAMEIIKVENNQLRKSVTKISSTVSRH